MGEFIPISKLFNLEKGELQSTKCTPGEFDFITAAEDWKTHNEYTHECEALIIAVAASGSLGRTHYVDGRFISSDLCFILTPKDEQKYPLNLAFYHFVFNSLRPTLVAATKSGTSKESINQTNLNKFEIPYFYIEQQNLWIAKIKNTITRKKLLDSELTQQQILLKKLRHQILQEAIEGKLTADWRAQNSPPLEGCQAQPGGVVKARNTKNYLKLPYNPKLKQRAKELRKAGNLSEVLFWNQVKRKQFMGLDFDRQKIIGNYIVDFYCPNCQVVVEIDGSSHDDKQEYDAQRDAYLERLGLTVIHILDVDVKNNLSGVVDGLRRHDAFRPPRQATPATPPEEGNDHPERYAPTPPKEGNDHPERYAPTPPEEGNWEPASELLKRIQAEKSQLIKDKKIKKQKPLPPISEEEKPFDLPGGWAWCRLGDTALMYEAGKSFKCIDRQILNNEWGVIKTSAITSSSFLESEHKYYQDNPPNDISKKVKQGDLIFCRASGSKGLAGKCCIVENSPKNLLLSDKTPRVILSKLIEKKYVFFHNESECTNFYYAGLNTGKSTSMNNITKGQLFEKVLPLPPLLEQKAIVAKVESLLALCDQLESQISQNQQHAEGVMQAVLKEAFTSNTGQGKEQTKQVDANA